MARVSSTSVTIGTVLNTLILCFGIYLLVCVYRLSEHENAKYVLPKLGDLYANQTLSLFAVLCLGVAALGYVVIFCFGDCCFNIYLSIAVSLIVTMGFCLFPILKDYGRFERAMRGEVQVDDVGAFGKNFLNNLG